jgi:hypothetical protein
MTLEKKGHVARTPVVVARGRLEMDGRSAMSNTTSEIEVASTSELVSHESNGSERAPAVVYLAAAKNTYGTRSYRNAVRRIMDEWPRAVVMDTAGCGFVSRADWYLRWPFIREGIDCLVVLGEDDGTISQDTWRELKDSREQGLPCWFVTGDGRLTRAESVRFRMYPTGTRTDRHWACAEVPPAA